MLKTIPLIFVLVLLLVACGDNLTPAPGAVVEVTRVVEVTKIVTVMVTSATTIVPATVAATPTIQATIPPTTTAVRPTATTVAATQATVTLVVNGKRNQDAIETREPKAGFTYFILDISITNNSDKKLSNGLTYFKVLSDQNFSYGYGDVSFLLPKGMKSTDLAKSESTRGELAFEVPTGEVMKSLRFENFSDKTTILIQ
ncbi:MAG: DUF4352 domain-containing protein [Taibaiella sp.]|nr:DUF4352 domain-containing protein [Taibaiella sp.]